MRERPILFSGPLVRAILDGRKTQTRRLVKDATGAFWDHAGWRPVVVGERIDRWESVDGDGRPDGRHVASVGAPRPACPYGAPGDRIYVRETWRTGVALDDWSPAKIAEAALEAGYVKPWAPLKYEADGATISDDNFHRGDFGGAWGKTRVAIHLPRWASRLLLEVTEVRVQRLQEITEDDARAEGVDADTSACDHARRTCAEVACTGPGYRAAFADLWNEINGERASWASNPWVWVITFRWVP